MTYSRFDILEHKNPYELFDDSDTFAEHQDILDGELSEEEQEQLAIDIVCGCPSHELAKLQKVIRALSSPLPTESSFYAVISDALHVKIRLMGMLDNRNTAPHTFLLEENTPDLLNRFNDLALQVLADNEIAIAERLALYTPKNERSKVAHRLNTIFSQSQFVAETEAAFILRRSIKHLLGEKPEQFFTEACHFSRDNCLKYSNMLAELLEGHEQEIGSKLSKTDAETQKIVMRQLELLSTNAYHTTNPFHLIKSNMTLKYISVSNSPGSLFTSSKDHEASLPKTPGEEQSNIAESSSTLTLI